MTASLGARFGFMSGAMEHGPNSVVIYMGRLHKMIQEVPCHFRAMGGELQWVLKEMTVTGSYPAMFESMSGAIIHGIKSDKISMGRRDIIIQGDLYRSQAMAQGLRLVRLEALTVFTAPEKSAYLN